MIHRLVYYSRNRLTDGALNAWMVRDILRVSQANNARVGVTGALMFNAGCFAQVLEGPRAAVEETFERIQQDERHGDVSLLDFSEAAERAFPGWSMGFVGASGENQTRFAAIAGESGFDPRRFTGERLFEALHRLAIEEEDAAAAA
jgi:hypothetical protein